jgi:hypothetical protein
MMRFTISLQEKKGKNNRKTKRNEKISCRIYKKY